jgi:hypothetical protein
MMAPPSAPAATAEPLGDHRTQFTELSCPGSAFKNLGLASPSLSNTHNFTEQRRMHMLVWFIQRQEMGDIKIGDLP